MIWLDYLFIFIFILNLFNGLKEGFIRQVVGLAGFFIALYFALSWSGAVSRYLQAYIKLDKVIIAISGEGVPTSWLAEVLLNILAFLLVFVVISLLLQIFAKKLKILNKVPLIGPLNIVLGGGLGIIKGFFVISLAVALLSLIKTPFWSNTMEASVIVALSQHYMALLYNFIFSNVVDNLGQLV